MTQPNQPQIPIDLTKSTGIFCENCDGMFFEQTSMFRRISRLLVGAPQDVILPVMVFVCRDCGTPLTSPDFMPEGMKDVEERLKQDSNESGTIKIEM